MTSSRLLFSVALGLIDGLLTALVLTAGVLSRGTAGITINQALRVATAAALSGLFTVFVSDYARLREELSHAARELNLPSVRRLLASKLSRKVRSEAAISAFITTVCSFLGAMIPLAPVALCSVAWVAFLAASIALIILGFALGHIVGGNIFVWAILLFCGGAVISLIGVWLNVVG